MSLSPSTQPSLRVLLTNSSSMYGGGEFYVLQLARGLQRRGHSVWISCRPDNPLLKKSLDGGIKTHPLDFPPQGNFVKYVRSLMQFLRANDIHLVHSNANYDRTVAALAARLAGCIHATSVHSLHSVQHNLTHWLRNRWATDRFLVDGVCVKELLEKKDCISASKISVVYPGVDPRTMTRNRALRKEIRDSYGLNESHVVIGHVGRFVPMKGHEVLLKAFSEIAPQYTQARLLLVGDGELMDELRTEANALGILRQTVFAGFRDDLRAMYSAFDLYAHPSLEGGGETFPFAVLQALAQELPVVVTSVGDVPAMIRESVNGYIVPHSDPHALAEKLLLLLSNEKRRREMGEEGLKLLLDRFTLEKTVDSIEQLYYTLLKNRG